MSGESPAFITNMSLRAWFAGQALGPLLTIYAPDSAAARAVAGADALLRELQKQTDMQQVQLALPEAGFVRLHHVLRVFPISRSSWYAGVRAGKYPKPVRLGPYTTAWRAEDIHALIRQHAKLGAVRSSGELT